MPHTIVKQPDGQYAIWSSVVESFITVNCTVDEVIVEEVANSPNYPGNLRADLFELLMNIELNGRASKRSPSFDEAIETIRELHGQEEVAKMLAFIADKTNST